MIVVVMVAMLMIGMVIMAVIIVMGMIVIIVAVRLVMLVHGLVRGVFRVIVPAAGVAEDRSVPSQ